MMFLGETSIRGLVADSEIVGIAMVKIADGKFVERWSLTEPVAPA